MSDESDGEDRLIDVPAGGPMASLDDVAPGEVTARFGPVVLVAATTVLFLVAYGWVATRVYLLNFSPEGPNATALLLVSFVTAPAVAVAARVSPSPRALYVGGTALAAVGLLASIPTGPALSGLAGVVAMWALTPVLVGLLADLRVRAAVGAGIGMLFLVAVEAWLTATPPPATLPGRILLVGLALAAVVLAAALVRADALAPLGSDAGRVSAVPLFVYLVVQAVYLVHPHVVARWTTRPYLPALAAAAAGLTAGVAWLADRGPPEGSALSATAAAFLLSVGLLVFVSPGPAVLALAPAQACAVVLLGAGCRGPGDRPLRRAVVGLAGAQFALVVGLFLLVGAFNYAFMPAALRPALAGLAPAYLLAVHATLPVAVGLVAWRRRATGPVASDADGGDSPGPVDPDRRSALGAVGLAVAGLVGGGLPGTRPSGGGPPYRVLTFNVHQYFDGTADGDFNLGAVRRVIADSDADVVGLQESDGTRVTSGGTDGVRWLAERLGYHASFGAPGRAGTVGVSLLSKWPIADTSVVFLPVGRSIPRPTLVATVEAPDGPLPVIVTHFETRKPGDRQPDQARRVVELASAFDRAVVLGDFNVPPTADERSYRILERSFTDAWTAAGHPETGTGRTWPAGDPERRIDYVWLRGDWRVTAATTVGTARASDHRGVLATIDPR